MTRNVDIDEGEKRGIVFAFFSFSFFFLLSYFEVFFFLYYKFLEENVVPHSTFHLTLFYIIHETMPL